MCYIFPGKHFVLTCTFDSKINRNSFFIFYESYAEDWVLPEHFSVVLLMKWIWSSFKYPFQKCACCSGELQLRIFLDSVSGCSSTALIRAPINTDNSNYGPFSGDQSFSKHLGFIIIKSRCANNVQDRNEPSPFDPLCFWQIVWITMRRKLDSPSQIFPFLCFECKTPAKGSARARTPEWKPIFCGVALWCGNMASRHLSPFAYDKNSSKENDLCHLCYAEKPIAISVLAVHEIWVIAVEDTSSRHQTPSSTSCD